MTRGAIVWVVTLALGGCGGGPLPAEAPVAVATPAPAAEGPAPSIEPRAEQPPAPVEDEPMSKPDAVKATLQKLFELCKAGDNATAAGHMVYRGSDETRRWKTVYRYDEPDERQRVDGLCLRISRMVSHSDEQQFLQFESETESEGEWLVWTVAFRRGGSTDKASFAFLDINGTLALGDID